MQPETRKHGLIGTTVILVISVLGVIAQQSAVYGSPEWLILHRVINVVGLPVFWTWELIFKICGVEGDQGLAYVFPIFITLILFLAGVGFGIGAVVGRLYKMQKLR